MSELVIKFFQALVALLLAMWGIGCAATVPTQIQRMDPPAVNVNQVAQQTESGSNDSAVVPLPSSRPAQ